MATYKAPEYDEKKYRQGIDTSYYTNAANAFAAQAEKNRAAQLGQAKKQQQSALKNAYINRAQNQLALNKSLATAGIRGGATETSNLRLANQYGQAVGAANADYSNSVNSINQNIDQSIFDYRQDMDARAEEYRQNQANARWQAAREDYSNAFNAQTAEVQRQTEYWSNYYINKYSGYSKKQLNNVEKQIKANLKKAKTQYERIKWQQALAGVGARRGVIATSK